MVAPIILTRDENGDLRDQEGHLRNEAGQKLNAQNEVISEPETAHTGVVQPVEEAARTLADYNRPDQFYTNRSAIRPPAIQRGDFELKPQYYTLVGQIPYYGLSSEHPMDHLESPHHGFNKVQLLCTFFRGIALKYQMALDTASEGNFTTRNPEDAVKLIDNLASSNSTKNIVRARSAVFLGKEQINEVQATLDNVHKLLNKQICSVEDAEADEEDDYTEAEVN
ncbi:hypothetical protein Bca101_009967 [Brassica carinata]